MPNIIDETYFERGNTYIPNNKDIAVEPTTSPTIVTELQFFITKYERELLLNALGVTLYDELQIALADLPNADQKWRDLVEGKTYTNVHGNIKRWNGLKGINEESVISFYVFTEYLRNDQETYATVGVVKNTAKNAEIANPTPKFISAYRQFIKSYQGSVTEGLPTIVVNGFGSIGIDHFNTSVEVSLLDFLSDSNDLDATAFPNFELRVYAEQNSFGI